MKIVPPVIKSDRGLLGMEWPEMLGEVSREELHREGCFWAML